MLSVSYSQYFFMWSRTISETVSVWIFLDRQYFDESQSFNDLLPLLELHPTQHLAIFSIVVILMSLMMCSQDAFSFRIESENSQPQ